MQTALFGHGAPDFDGAFSRIRHEYLGEGAWIEHQAGWLSGHQQVFEALRDATHWNQHRRQMYDRLVDVPRLTARLPDAGPGHPILQRVAAALTERYQRPLDRIGLAYYRSGRDSVALHGDRLGEHKRDTVVAIVSVGEPRRFLLKPASGGSSRRLDLGWGDLFVMGGTCQATWLHGVPKLASASPRISIQFRCHGIEPDPQPPSATQRS